MVETECTVSIGMAYPNKGAHFMMMMIQCDIKMVLYFGRDSFE